MPRSHRDHFLLQFHTADTAVGVTRETLKRIAHQLDISETEAVHLALAKLAKAILPTYEPDDGLLTEQQLDTMQKAASPTPMKLVKNSLF